MIIEIGDKIEGLIVFFIWMWLIKCVLVSFFKSLAEAMVKRAKIIKETP